jgi:hypothetical protein
VGVEIAGQQYRLEEQHGGDPHRRRAAEQRQHQPRIERLHPEQQQGAQPQRHGVERQHPLALSGRSAFSRGANIHPAGSTM